MGITSLYFVVLSLLSVFIYYFLKQEFRVIFLTLLSCAFIATYSYYLLLYVIIYALINYYIGIRIPDSKYKKSIFILGIVINLSQLILLKYASFTLDPLVHIFNLNLDFSILSKIIIPVGVSFFTLQGIGYLINVHLGWEKSEKNFIHFLLYIIFFPRFLSGPIDRSNRFLPQLRIYQSFNEQKVTEGLRLVLVGSFKKVAIADQLATVINYAYLNLDASDKNSFLIILLIQPFYLFFDFSGYTDIAIGFARAFGIEIPHNFNRPFTSESMSEFWKRFHMSLSSWFHDYVFIRTVFRYRKWGKRASTFALFLTWVLFGIWHGAGWNFMLLGLLQALAIYYEFVTKKWRTRIFSKLPSLLKVWLGRIFTYLFFSTALIFFFAPDVNTAFVFFSKLIQVNGIVPADINAGVYLLVCVFIIIFLGLEIIKNDYPRLNNTIESFWISNNNKNILFRWAIYFLLITIVLVFNKVVQQFIYFQF